MFSNLSIFHGRSRREPASIVCEEQGDLYNQQGRNPWLWAKLACLYTDLLQALKGALSSSGFSTYGFLISASTAPHCGVTAIDEDGDGKRLVQLELACEANPV